MEWTNCNLCGSDRTELYREGHDRQLGGSERFCLVRCLQCGLIYLNPRPCRDEIARYYPADYEPFTRLSRHQGGRLARWSYRRYLDKRCARLPKIPGHLLDVGCATGDFLARAREHGWQVQGVEPSQAAAEAARRQYDLDVFAGDLSQAHFPDGHFDAVTMWDVLEHVYDPRAELSEIHRIVKAGGLLLIELPNMHSFDAALFGPYWIGLDMPRHLHLFPPAALDALLEQTGFERGLAALLQRWIWRICGQPELLGSRAVVPVGAAPGGRPVRASHVAVAAVALRLPGLCCRQGTGDHSAVPKDGNLADGYQGRSRQEAIGQRVGVGQGQRRGCAGEPAAQKANSGCRAGPVLFVHGLSRLS